MLNLEMIDKYVSERVRIRSTGTDAGDDTAVKSLMYLK